MRVFPRFPAIQLVLLLAALIATVVLATPSEASEISVAGDFGVRELFPDQIQHLDNVMNRMRQIKQAYGRTRDRGRKYQLKAQYQTLQAQGIALRKDLRAVQITRVVVYGAAGELAERSMIIGFLRTNPGWRGGVVHIWLAHGKWQTARQAPRRYDVSRPPPRYNPSVRAPQPSGLPPLSGRRSNGLYGLGGL